MANPSYRLPALRLVYSVSCNARVASIYDGFGEKVFGEVVRKWDVEAEWFKT